MSFPRFPRSVVLLVVTLAGVSPVLAQATGAPGAPTSVAPGTESLAPDASAAPWQDVITGQIEAFRERDASGAFGFAGAAFHVSYPSAEAFFEAIITSGYSPIMESRSHSFGAFQMVSTIAVVQEVRFQGGDLSLYRAVYQLTREPEGWRVQGVQLLKEPGLAI